MRVLVALDGSPEADRARSLAASIDWPPGTTIEILSVARPLNAYGADASAGGADAARADLEQVVADAAALLGADDATVRPVVRSGRPATTIVEEADRLRADLVVVGSRGFGPIPSMLLGSVSAEVADHAACPVLVARNEAVGSLLVGVDGSVQAQAAVDFLAGFRFLAGRPAVVVSVAPQAAPPIDPFGGMAYGVFGDPAERMTATSAARLADHGRVAAEAARDLAAAGYEAECDVREGDPAHVLIGRTSGLEDPLVVLGTHGRTGITRAVLGSVARNVLLHAPCSVLIVRGPLRERTAERAVATERNRVASLAFGLLPG